MRTGSQLRKDSSGSMKTQVARITYIGLKALRTVIRGKGAQRYLDHKFAHLSLAEVQDFLEAFGAEGVECVAFAGDFINIRPRPAG